MKIKCKVPFGNFVPGDEAEIPDGAVFDESNFERVPDSAPATALPSPDAKANPEGVK